MPFGITPASSIFQQKIEETPKGIKGVVVYCDDILVTGDCLRSHIENLNAVLERLKKAGLTVRTDKCKFFQPEVEYLGHIINRDRLKISETKVRAIINAPTPKTVTQVQSFCGFV